jgi:hypothetical protein
MCLHAQRTCLSLRSNTGNSKVHEASLWTLTVCSQVWDSAHLLKIFHRVRFTFVHTGLDWAGALQGNTCCSKSYAALPVLLLGHCQDPFISLFSQKLSCGSNISQSAHWAGLCRGPKDWNLLALLDDFHAGLFATGSGTWTLTPIICLGKACWPSLSTSCDCFLHRVTLTSGSYRKQFNSKQEKKTWT